MQSSSESKYLIWNSRVGHFIEWINLCFCFD